MDNHTTEDIVKERVKCARAADRTVSNVGEGTNANSPGWMARESG